MNINRFVVCLLVCAEAKQIFESVLLFCMMHCIDYALHVLCLIVCIDECDPPYLNCQLFGPSYTYHYA